MVDQSHQRPEIRVKAAVVGWPHPWPNVAEIAEALPSNQWTLIGGLMTQLHTVHCGLGVVRPTNDVDIVLYRDHPRRTRTRRHGTGGTGVPA